MNLYKILCDHYAPKDCCHSMMGYILAENDEQIYEFVKNDASITFNEYISWGLDEDGLYWNEQTEEDDLTHKEYVLRNKGELHEESLLDDLYYGQTLIGWETVAENVNINDFQKSIELGIIKQI